jgi:hypothetical protein
MQVLHIGLGLYLKATQTTYCLFWNDFTCGYYIQGWVYTSSYLNHLWVISKQTQIWCSNVSIKSAREARASWQGLRFVYYLFYVILCCGS